MFRCLIILTLFLASCDLFREKPSPVCESSLPNLKLKLVQMESSSSCINPNGVLSVEATTGVPPFRFSIDGGAFQGTGDFTGLFAGEHLIRLLDARGCEGFLLAKVEIGGNVLSASFSTSPDDKCFSDAGTITLFPKGGVKPYRFKRDSLFEQHDSIFFDLKKGFYWVKVIDTNDCEYQLLAEIKHGNTGTSYSKHVQPVITSYCAYSGCHNGDVGTNNNFLIFSNVKTYGLLLVRYATDKHRVEVPENEIAYIRCWVEDGSPQN